MVKYQSSDTFVARVCTHSHPETHPTWQGPHTAPPLTLVTFTKKAKKHVEWKHTNFNKIHNATIFSQNYMEAIALTLYYPDSIIPSNQEERIIYFKRFSQHIGFEHKTKPLFICKVIIDLDRVTRLSKIVTAFPVNCNVNISMPKERKCTDMCPLHQSQIRPC